MRVFGIQLHVIVGILFGLTFAALLAVRLGVFETAELVRKGDQGINLHLQTGREHWMNVLQNGKKIGYVHREFSKMDQGYRITESTLMQMNTMGVVQDIRFRTDGYFHEDLSLSSFDFDLQSGFFSFKAQGILQGKALLLTVGAPGSERTVNLTLEKDTFLPIGILEALNRRNLKTGDARSFHVFDPSTQALRTIKVVMIAEETIPVMGRQERAKKVSVDFMGAPQFAWLGEDGTVLKEEGSFGITLEKVSREEALQQTALSASADLTEMASIPSNKVIGEAAQLKEMRLRIEGIDVKSLSLNGDRQELDEDRLTIRKESFVNVRRQQSNGKMSRSEGASLKPTPLIQSDHPEIQARAKEIVGQTDPATVRARKLVNWVYQNIEKKPVLSVPNAVETLRHRVGDCNEHAILLAALARADDIPTQIEAGIVYQNGRFYYHAWNTFYLGRWITADSVMGQFPADVTHVRFARGTENQVDLMQLIGRLKIEVLSYQ